MTENHHQKQTETDNAQFYPDPEICIVRSARAVTRSAVYRIDGWKGIESTSKQSKAWQQGQPRCPDLRAPGSRLLLAGDEHVYPLKKQVRHELEESHQHTDDHDQLPPHTRPKQQDAEHN